MKCVDLRCQDCGTILEPHCENKACNWCRCVGCKAVGNPAGTDLCRLGVGCHDVHWAHGPKWKAEHAA